MSIEREAQIDIDSDFLDQANSLLIDKKVHPAAPTMIIKASLEEFLRNWVEEADLKIQGKPGLDLYAKSLREEKLITKQAIKDITSWGGFRNHAAHGEWDEVGDKNRISLMLEGVNLLMRKYGVRMYEKEKIEESKYFHSRMIEQKEDRKVFRYSLSVFLPAARSVMQYSLDEATNKRGGQKRHDEWINSSPVLEFFKCKRNFNIYIAPIDSRMHAKDTAIDVVLISDSLPSKFVSKDGKVIEEREIREERESIERAEPSESELKNEFPD